jgi:S-adenosylmethionine hydrolase
MSGVITLITDFGTKEGYVGAMKGVILSIAPEVQIVDITHDIPFGRVSKASLVLESIQRYYPDGTVHLVVVDPGVGSRRRAVAVESAGQFFVGPDNGVLEPAYRADKIFNCCELSDPEYHLKPVSFTFHGRDIFAPAAAYLARGVKLEKLGKQVQNPVRLASGRKKIISNERLVGRVIYADRFGNLITDIIAQELELLSRDKSRLGVSICGKRIEGIYDYYSQSAEGELIALVGSTGRLEVAITMDSAFDHLGPLSEDAEVTIFKI